MHFVIGKYSVGKALDTDPTSKWMNLFSELNREKSYYFSKYSVS